MHTITVTANTFASSIFLCAPYSSFKKKVLKLSVNTPLSNTLCYKSTYREIQVILFVWTQENTLTGKKARLSVPSCHTARYMFQILTINCTCYLKNN